MQALLNRTKTFLTPTGSSTNLTQQAGFRTEKQAEALFAQPDPKVDGEDCLQDCASCTEALPRKWEIDNEDKLYGHVNGWETHLIVGTGKTDWVRDVADEKGSLMEAVGNHGVNLKNGKLMLSASNMPTTSHCGSVYEARGMVNDGKNGYENEGRTRCIALPRWEVFDGVGVNEAEWLLRDVVERGNTNSSPLPLRKEDLSQPNGAKQEERANGEIVVQKEDEPNEPEQIPDVNGLSIRDNQQAKTPQLPSTSLRIPPGVESRPLPHRAIILMCSHGTRDWRCGKSAPILKREIERHLRPLGLYRDFDDERPGGVGIYFINHVGGHKYSANVMVYRRQGRWKDNGEGMVEELSGEAVQGIWLARVRPEDCENIVKFTVLQGKVVKPGLQLRGGFDRERGVLSW